MSVFKSRTIRTSMMLILVYVSVTGSAFGKIQDIAKLKAVYIYNIAKFTRWQDSQWSSGSRNINFCVYGENDVISELADFDKVALNSNIVRIIRPENVEEFSRCHILYVSPSEKRRYRYILSLVDGLSIVTISNHPSFLRNGGLINLVEKEARLRFEVNKNILQKQRVVLSSKLLKMAILVEE